MLSEMVEKKYKIKGIDCSRTDWQFNVLRFVPWEGH
jgi:hypothetical protein